MLNIPGSYKLTETKLAFGKICGKFRALKLDEEQIKEIVDFCERFMGSGCSLNDLLEYEYKCIVGEGYYRKKYKKITMDDLIAEGIISPQMIKPFILNPTIDHADKK